MGNGLRLRDGLAGLREPAGADAALTCDECGYDLRAAEPGRPCPECGRAPQPRGATVPAGAVWTVSVTAGLLLLLLITLYAVSSVLVQRANDALAGVLPSLNLPGPKLWAVPLLQRPIGRSPELPGVIGTRTAMLSVLAIWLITTRPPTTTPGGIGDRGRPAEPLRLATRWATVVLFGANFGVLLSQQGLWPDDLPPYRVMLVCTAELPGAALLYLYLRQLSAQLPGRERRRAFDLLAWAAPAVVAGGGAMLTLDWLSPADKAVLGMPSVRLPLAAGYGVAAVCAGAAASAGVGWLAGAFALRAFPAGWRALLGTRRWIRSLRAQDNRSPRARPGRDARAYAIAAGLVLLPVVMVFGIEQVGWFTARRGIAGNLPFYNYPGPKLWAAALVPELAARDYWEPIVSRAWLTALNLLAFWLVTVDPRATGEADGESRGARLLRRAVRWLPVMLVGAMLGCAGVVRDDNPYDGQVPALSHRYLFASITVLAELPATVLLYVYLAVLARRFGRPRLRAGFVAMSGLLVVLAGAGLSAFVLHRALGTSARSEPSVIAGSAAYGAVVLAAATWSVVAILSLAAAVHASRRGDRAVAAATAPP